MLDVQLLHGRSSESEDEMSDIWGKIRTTGLVVMISCAVLADAILYWQGQYVWAIFWSCIIGLVALFEIVSYIVWHKTISTMWKEWAQKNKTSAMWAYITLGLLATSLLGLWVHLAFWGGMFNN